jgi:transposase
MRRHFVEYVESDEVAAQKKSLKASEQTRPDVVAAREAFIDLIKTVPAQDFIVIDESYATTKFTRLRGRAKRGVRLHASVPHGHWKLMTILGAITMQGMQASMSIDATTDTDVFGAFVMHVLVPTLRPGQVVVMDNLGAHKVNWIRERIERAGCRVVYLPPYSPDLSPIEPMWAKVKQLLRTAAERTIDGLHQAIADALSAITAADCQGSFRHCGYTAHMR